MRSSVLSCCSAAHTTVLDPSGLFFPSVQRVNTQSRTTDYSNLYREGHILIQTRLAALLETTSSLATNSPGLALCLPARLAVRAPPYSLPSTSALGQTGQQLGFHADSTCGNKKRSERLIHCSFSRFIIHQKDAASSILPTYKPRKFSGKNQQKSF